MELKKQERRQLKTKRLREYTIKSHSSMPPNHTYVDFERFAQLLEDMEQMESSFGSLAAAHDSLQEEVDAMASAYSQKEARFKQESEGVRQELSQIRYGFRKVEASKRSLQEDLFAFSSGLAAVAARFRDRQTHFDLLGAELSHQLTWVQEAMGSRPPEGGDGCTFSAALSSDVSQALKELLKRSCGGDQLEGVDLELEAANP